MAKKKKAKRTHSQIGKHSRRKGKAFECQMARYFTAWTGTKWETTRNSGRTDLNGDIYAVEYPDMKMVIECKHRASYTVHAMLKPTKAFTDMIKETLAKIRDDQYVVFIIKNETGIWMANTMAKKSGFWYSLCFVTHTGDVGMTVEGIDFHKIQDYCSDEITIEEVSFGKNPKKA